MPRKTTITDAQNLKWNMYVNKIDKANYIMALAKSGKLRCQSAGVRAFMHLYATDEELRNKVNNVIDDFLVYKEDGGISQL